MEPTLRRNPVGAYGRPAGIRTLLRIGLIFVVAPQAHALSEPHRAIKVEDAIGMTVATDRKAAPDDPQTLFRQGYANFSPDGAQFVIVVKTGNVERNTNDYSILRYRTDAIFDKPKPDAVLTMSSASNRPAIQGVRWDGNDALIFLGENSGEVPQVYRLDLAARRLTRLTNVSTEIIDAYALSAAADALIYTAACAGKTDVEDSAEMEIKRNGFVLPKKTTLAQALFGGRPGKHCDHLGLFVQERGQTPVEISVSDDILPGYNWPPTLSPNGRYGTVEVQLRRRSVPDLWRQYDYGADNDWFHSFDSVTDGAERTPLRQVLLVDVENHTAKPLLNSANVLDVSPVWSVDGQTVYLKGTWLPLDVSDAAELAKRRKTRFDVAISVPGGEIRNLAEGEWPHPNTGVKPPVTVRLEQDLNTPPRLIVADSPGKREGVLLDLNPQFKQLRFGEVRAITWKTAAAGQDCVGGLYLPPDYVPGRHYPLVLQTHGFDEHTFSMDGRSEWSSGFAARFLAARGILVLQVGHSPQYEAMKVDPHSNRVQADRQWAAVSYEAAIDYLDRQGMVDRERVGIMGFSMTVAPVAYLLTHSRYPFAAALLVQGVDGGYFQYLLGPGRDTNAELMNGNAQPWGAGLNAWREESPSFSLDRVHASIRLEEHGATGGPSSLSPRLWLLEEWEWFAGLSKLGKPVEYFFLPDADHLIVKPWERQASQQGAVDWFRFWLQGFEDPAAEKVQQYRRWENLCDMQVEQNPNQATFCVRSKPH